MEDFYREIYAVNGITDIKFPEHYPVSRLLGMFPTDIYLPGSG
jgi:activating signal cointegrator 1